MQLTLELPPEFLALCQQDNIAPEAVLSGFIADLCNLQDMPRQPRPDGYNRNGSDEHQLAREYYARVGYPDWSQGS